MLGESKNFSYFNWKFWILEFDVDEELPDDEEIERRFSHLLVRSWFQSFKILIVPTRNSMSQAALYLWAARI